MTRTPPRAPAAGRRALPPWTLRRGLQNLFWIYASGLVFMIFSVADLLSGEFDTVHTVIGSVQVALIAFGYLCAAWVSDASLRVRWAYVVGFAALLGSTAIVWGWGFADNGVYLAIMLATLIPWRQSRVAIPVLGAILSIISAISGELTPVYIAVIGVGVGLATAAGIESGRVSVPAGRGRTARLGAGAGRRARADRARPARHPRPLADGDLDQVRAGGQAGRS